MAFDYDKSKSRTDGSAGEHWTSNSDLFMVLSVVFLLLYVVSSVKTGASNISNAAQSKEIAKENEDLKRQLRAYNTLKGDYLKNGADENESKMYEDLMANLELLQSESERKRKELVRKANKNAKTTESLNQYQQMVRNIINTNLLAKKRIKKRDNVIVEKKEIITGQKNTIITMDQTITDQATTIESKAKQIAEAKSKIEEQENEIVESQQDLQQKKEEINSLESNLSEKRELINKNEEMIANLNGDLTDKIKKLKLEAKAKKKTQKQMRKEVLTLRLSNQKKINNLKKEKESIASKLSGLESDIDSANERLEIANLNIQEKEAQKERLEMENRKAEENFKSKVSSLQNDFENKINSQRKDLQAKLKKEQVSAAEKAARLAEFKKQAQSERAKLESNLSELESKVTNAQDALGEMEQKAKAYQAKLDSAKKDHKRFLASVSDLKEKNQNLSGDLKKYKKIVEAKKKLARDIKKKLASKGVKANVDGKTGEVTINFGDEYFDSGSANLKNHMKDVLQKFLPEYSSALFNDKNIAKNIKNVEIIGFSSPTYKGKFVDPKSLAKKDRAALNYNLDLSFKRAKSIFTYMTDVSRMKFKYQKKITPLVKVTGRSYLAEGVEGRDLASSLSRKQYCKKFDCKKSQKVIIRFNLKD
jgi:chromosome segregation ATPase